MGCTQSKIENEEAVARCKDRKQFMKDAVSSRNAFAAAHSAYTMSLKNTGAALNDYAHGEVQNHPQFSAAANSSSSAVTGTTAQPTFESLPPPPPPLPNFPASPLQRAASMPEFKISKPESRPADTIIEEEDEEDMEDYEQSSGLKLRGRNSGHRGTASLGGGNRNMGVVEEQDDDGPPPPPSPPSAVMSERAPPPPMPENKDSTWDFFFAATENIPGPSLSGVEEVRVDKEEIQRNAFEERSKRIEDGDVGRRSGKSEAVAERVVEAQVVVPPPPPVAARKIKQGTGTVSVDGRRGGKGAENVNLLQIFTKLDDHFLMASESAHEVSKMLEATRLHYHSNFADNRGHIDHSARVMRVITWNRSFRGLPNADDGKDDFDSEEHETHATVLDKLLAWEKKLYDEVKAGELMKFDYHRKVALLSKQKKRNPNSESLEKTKAAVSHLHTRYIVDMQSLDSTVLEINRLRDDQLYPKLVALVDGMATMWETMRAQHENQSKIALILRSVDISQAPKETSEHHHERTIQLWAVVQEWHVQFEKLVINQKEYIKFLNNWLKLNLIPIESSLKEKVSSPPRPQNPPIQALLRVWHDYLDKLPDEVARSAIHNFAAVVQTIMQHQEEEMKLKEKCEETRKELTRKTRQFEDWYNKYMQRKIPEEMDPERTDGNAQRDDAVTERKFVVDALKKRLEDEEEAHQKQCLQVREKAWTSLKLRLPDLFRAMSDFSLSCSEMYMNLRSISNLKHNSTESLS